MSDSTKPVLTWVRLLVGLGIVLFGMTASLDSVSTTDTPPRHCNGTAIEVAFTGGTGSSNLRDACRAEGRGQAEVGAVVSLIGGVILGWRRVRRWAKARDDREPGVTFWRRGNPLRPFAVVTVCSLVFLVTAASGWDVGGWVVGLFLISPIVVPLVLVVIRPRIEARPDRLVIQNALYVCRLAWADVAGVEATRRGIDLTLRSGGQVRAAAVRTRRRTRHGVADPADQVVRVLRAQAKEAGGPGLVFGWGAADSSPPPPTVTGSPSRPPLPPPWQPGP